VAFDLWHRARVEDRIPAAWDPGRDPLWPAEYGGETWARGSGSVRCAEPRGFYGIARTEPQRADLERFLGREQAAELISHEPRPENAEYLLPHVEAAAGDLVGART
jgi:hypothetical protein